MIASLIGVPSQAASAVVPERSECCHGAAIAHRVAASPGRFIVPATPDDAQIGAQFEWAANRPTPRRGEAGHGVAGEPAGEAAVVDDEAIPAQRGNATSPRGCRLDE